MSRLLFVFWGLLFLGPAHGQERGLIAGVVMDAQGTSVAGATIVLLNTSRAVITGKDGHFQVAGVWPGRYTLVCSATGFATARYAVEPGQASLPVRLDVAGKRLGEVVVTAQRQQEMVSRLPLAITALDARQVQDYRLWNSRDITAIVPNLYSADPGDGRNATGIRGIVTTDYNPTVATYIDGVNQFSLDTYIFQLFDVERIEVLRGPQGTLYGRNALGGVINIITREPDNGTHGYVELSAGDYGRQRYSAVFRAALIPDKLFLGVAGVFDGRNGYYRNEYNDQSYDRQHSWTGNYYLRYKPAAGWDVTLNVKHADNLNHGPFPLVIGDAFTRPFVLDQNAVTTMVDNTFDGSLAVSYKGHAFNFSAQTAYQQNSRVYQQPIDGDFSLLDAVTVVNNYGRAWNRPRTWTEEIKFSSPGGTVSPLTWTVGSYLYTNDNPSKQGTHYGDDAAAVGSPITDFTSINTTRSHDKGVAVYGQAVYAFSKEWRVTAGLRYDIERQNEDALGQGQQDGQPVFVTIPDTAGRASSHSFSPKLALDYAPSRDELLYAGYSRGFRAGGLTQLSTDPTQPPLYAYRPEYSDNYEMGLKSGFFDGRVHTSIALFVSTVDQVQVPTLLLPAAITVTRNTGHLTSKGVEAEIAAKPVKGLELNYSVGYTHARYDRLNLSDNGAAIDLAGDRPIFTPDFTSLLAAQYTYALKPKSQTSIFVRGEWRWLGDTWFDLANTIKQAQYSLINASAGVEWNHYGVKLWTRNLGNQRYIAYAYDFGGIHLGDPVTRGVTVHAGF